jgi:type IV secretion system protein VirB5
MQKKGFYGDLLQHYSEMLPKIDTNLLSSNQKDRDVVGYRLSKDNTQSAFAATEAVYNQLDKRLKTIEELMGQIDKTQNIKEAMDLNSRIVAETGFISLDLARLNSMQLSLQAVFQNESNRELENHSEFFSKPK